MVESLNTSSHSDFQVSGASTTLQRKLVDDHDHGVTRRPCCSQDFLGSVLEDPFSNSGLKDAEVVPFFAAKLLPTPCKCSLPDVQDLCCFQATQGPLKVHPYSSIPEADLPYGLFDPCPFQCHQACTPLFQHQELLCQHQDLLRQHQDLQRQLLSLTKKVDMVHEQKSLQASSLGSRKGAKRACTGIANVHNSFFC